MCSQVINDYLAYTHHLSRELNHKPHLLQELLYLIEKNKNESQQNSLSKEFFTAEHAFYTGHYEKSLKHYLEAKGLEKFDFFCYRASAHVAKTQGYFEKATVFINKALQIIPDDIPSLMLLESILTRLERFPEAKTVQEKICSLKSKFPPHLNFPVSEPSISKNLEENMEELTSIFQKNKENEELFFENLYESLNEKCIRDKSIAMTQILPGISPKVTSSKNKQAHELAIETFQKNQSQLMGEYRDQWKNREQLDNYFYVFQGWPKETNDLKNLQFLTEESRKSTGGFYLRWNHKGVVLNPGKNFLRNFHQQGLHIKDIDYVIVTNDNSDSYSDLKEIYEVNYQLNKIDETVHVIHYYLNQRVYQELSSFLKPHFKQEKYSIHHLELFVDLPEVEEIDLGYGINLHYFPASNYTNSEDDEIKNFSTALGLRIELTNPQDLFTNQQQSIHLGFLSGLSWSPILATQIYPCDVLIAGFGNVYSEDLNRKIYSNRNLGYFGTLSLAEELKPTLILCTEFNGKMGDLRLEIVKKMREEQSNGNIQDTTILPADTGLFIDLKTLKIQCSVNQSLIAANQALVVRSKSDFSRLSYLSSCCSL